MTQSAVWPVARLRQIGSGAWIGAAALAVIGTFLPLLERHFGPTNSYLITVWGYVSANELDLQEAERFVPMGVPLLIGVVLLVAAGLLGLASTRLHPASGAVLASRLLGTGAAGLVAGSSTIIFIVVGVFDGTPSDAPPGYANATGFGSWLLTGSMAISFAAIALMLVPKLSPRGEEPETPAMGIPVVRVLDPEYEETDPKG
ncbi:hypothetical protein JOF56_004529 [Kibdelosporangium banguiense]|uniref:DUF2567 domain-containing protein n=1 Tax=Kibdelosporangium banguiense TaxID=1365924 RepID=A0ABS4TJG3_9PSEU|nr:hypothetical protein [Kibdelosporangium banguiense]MBP2324144.1 hypothetical protein [Kibdelosporangium banguiense]